MKTEFHLLLLIAFLNLTFGAVVFDSFTPDNSSCLEPGGFGCLCDSDRDCSQKHLECIDYKCFCLNPMHRIYDNQRNLCVSLVGSKCNKEKGGLKCIRNSECDDGRCVCNEGYSVNSKLMCSLSYGEDCGPFQCNIERGLACKSGICKCLDSSYVYSALTQKCFDPETFVANLIRWFGHGLFRESLFHSISKIFNLIVRILKFPKRLIFPFG